MVADLIRDSPFGHIVRLVTRNKVFQYPEERDPELWKKYVHEEKSGYMAHHGTAEPPEEESEDLNNARGVRARDSDSSVRTEVGDGYNVASGAKVDPEKGKDKHVIDWYGDDDPQVNPSPSRPCRSTSLTKLQ
jgi:DHA1 family multidrug resistance protein-like MFS transporter